MKRLQALTLFAVAALAPVSRSIAQVHGVQAVIPFNFTVGDRLLPAGNYTIQETNHNVLSIANHEHTVYTNTVALHDQGGNSGKSGKLLFKRHGDEYFLRRVICDGVGLNMTLPGSKREKQAVREQASLSQTSLVLVAAR